MASFEARGSEMFKEEWVHFDEEEPDTGDYYVAIDLAGFEEVGKAYAAALMFLSKAPLDAAALTSAFTAAISSSADS